ncbi:hypothetical protein RhiJN_02270 [Ceratobasidium sp. AG-Ba]|nr:hypothetical protein RhiJN_02270 [Ceratobasidium sp. AG-Ba]QRW03202.1 hypothetical protein RhiLY_02201 [Ceratobasidium sp. AG-Ba]
MLQSTSQNLVPTEQLTSYRGAGTLLPAEADSGRHQRQPLKPGQPVDRPSLQPRKSSLRHGRPAMSSARLPEELAYSHKSTASSETMEKELQSPRGVAVWQDLTTQATVYDKLLQPYLELT